MKRAGICSAAGMFLISLCVLLSIIDYCSFDRSFYRKEYAKDSTAERIGMSENDLYNATDVLLDYLQMERDDIRVTATVNGYVREVYDKRETMHMVDVRNLYQNALKARNIALIFGTVLLAAAWLMIRSDHRTMLKKGLRSGVSLLGVVIRMIVVWCLADFNGFWLFFHEVFFDNDLYLLDPNVSIMINMFPSVFFFDLVLRIIVMFTGFLVLLTLLIYKLPGRKRYA
ncbi:MAG: TIGR01906 family membrane protein [Solobacterium sp.]|nr:TIGR01906 family membrane protein [Solobacterium sp.]